MNLQLNLSSEESKYLEKLKRKKDELVVPINLWLEHIANNARIKEEDFPPSLMLAEYVITERDWFCSVVSNLKYLYIENKRLTKEQGGVWLTHKLEPKKTLPKHDIFDVGQRQPGSFRSGG